MLGRLLRYKASCTIALKLRLNLVWCNSRLRHSTNAYWLILLDDYTLTAYFIRHLELLNLNTSFCSDLAFCYEAAISRRLLIKFALTSRLLLIFLLFLFLIIVVLINEIDIVFWLLKHLVYRSLEKPFLIVVATVWNTWLYSKVISSSLNRLACFSSWFILFDTNTFGDLSDYSCLRVSGCTTVILC